MGIFLMFFVYDFSRGHRKWLQWRCTQAHKRRRLSEIGLASEGRADMVQRKRERHGTAL